MLRSKRRGFTVLELVTVLAVMGVAAATTVPYFMGMRARADLRSRAKKVQAHFEEAKALARSGRSGFAGWGADDRVVQAGLRFTGPSSYELFVDANRRIDGQGEETLAIVTLEERYVLTPLREEVRFRRNGTLADGSSFELSISDTRSALSRTVEVAYGGRVRVER